MKTLLSLPSFLLAAVAWVGAVVDYSLAKVSATPRAYLVPGRTFYAAYRTCLAYLMKEPIDFRTFRIREYPRHKCF